MLIKICLLKQVQFLILSVPEHIKLIQEHHADFRMITFCVLH